MHTVKGCFVLFNDQCGDRLKTERTRLGLSQQAAAALIPVRREMWSRYERGEAEPGASVLVGLAEIGADVVYILTGERDGPAPVTLTTDEQVLLDGYRALDAATRRRMLAFMLGGSEGKPSRTVSQVIHGDVGHVSKGNITHTAPVTINVGGRKKPKSE